VQRSGRWSDARERTEQIMVRVHLVPLERDILRRAGTIDSLPLRTLDAIHVAAALVLDLDDLEFITYDQRMARAATAHGLKVVQPGLRRD
ncbi:MAG: type II toxin-antitoxin system VapC family toxin, partial [Vicinamibacterales bacterium]